MTYPAGVAKNGTKIAERIELKPGIAKLCPGAVNATNCSPAGSEMRVLIVECFATFVFVSVILAVKSYNSADDGPVNCLAVGGTLYGMLKVAGDSSGGCLNPAVGIA